MTMNNTWGWKADDKNWKSTKTLVHNLIDIVSKGGNYLLNVGPTQEGLIPNPSIDRLEEMGLWLKKNGESIYGATASPFEKPLWGRYTQKDGKIFVHIFDWPEDGKLVINEKIDIINKVYVLSDKSQNQLEIENLESGLIIHLPIDAYDYISSVIVIE